jgi:putative colanic acid biosynthesis acetyltransferase WcaF
MERTSEIQTNLARYDNSWYNPGPLWKRVLWHIAGRLFINTYLPIPGSVKTAVLKAFGARIYPGVVIKPAVNIKYPWFLTVENNTWIGENVWIDNLTKVTIGKNVCLSQGAMLLTGNHDYSRSAFDLKLGEIRLHDGVWIGAKAVVCPGVTCHTHAVLTVNSVASKDLGPFGIYKGNPAVRIKTRQIKD